MSVSSETMHCDQVEMPTKAAHRIRPKGMTKLDQIRAFEVAVMDYKMDPSDKNWCNVDKILQVRQVESINIRWLRQRAFFVGPHFRQTDLDK